ncbi:high mobility group B2 [Euphorbia peplus]|nr:high mobility group B2 [Euphorbia peplus]
MSNRQYPVQPNREVEEDRVLSSGIAASVALLLLLYELNMKTAKGKAAGASKGPKEALKPADNRKIGKRKATAVTDKSSKPIKKGKKAKQDPDKPKRPASAFFVFLEEFRITFKKENPDMGAVAAVGKAGGEKWRSLTPAEKAPYEAKAAKRKEEYGKQMNAYNKKQESKAAEVDEESDKSKSEVHDDEDDEATGGEEDDDDEEDEDDD